jgi:hypothetical protein
MPAFTLHDDPDPIDRARGIDLADAGLPGYCATILINGAGEEVLLLAAYSQGVADTDWARIAPHEIVNGLPVYWKQ